jgi:hypothetical protein
VGLDLLPGALPPRAHRLREGPDAGPDLRAVEGGLA